MRIENEILLDFDDVLIKPKRSTLNSRNEVSLFREFTFKYGFHKYKGIPIMAANMDGVGTFKMVQSLSNHGLFTCLRKHYSVDEINDWKIFTETVYDHYAISIGANDSDYNKLNDISYPKNYICIDVANGYHEKFVDFVKKIRNEYEHSTIIAGNVATGEMTEELILAGADLVKIGIGSGKFCSTRKVTGVGIPQLSAIIECADAAHGLGGHIIADGGCSTPGDIVKAFGAGADFVMLGGMLAGHEEGSSSENLIGTNNTVKFYGMSSKSAQIKYNGGKAKYRAAEGIEIDIPYRGKVSDTIEEILGGLRSACTYTGSKSLKELSKRTTFIRVGNNK
ncbi:MAG: GMP reductase [Candidatus Paceibacterota bacterium]